MAAFESVKTGLILTSRDKLPSEALSAWYCLVDGIEKVLVERFVTRMDQVYIARERNQIE